MIAFGRWAKIRNSLGNQRFPGELRILGSQEIEI